MMICWNYSGLWLKRKNVDKLEKKITDIKTESLASGGGFVFGDIPVRKFFDQAQYIEKTILPAIAKRSGSTSGDYKFFDETVKCLLYGTILIDRQNQLVMKTQHLKQLNELLQARVDLAEKELLKYTTVEDLMLTESMDKIAANVINRLKENRK
jgi:hypothetical protein